MSTPDIQEIIDRCRRIETRLTRYMEWSGFDTQSKMPLWDNGKVIVPSVDVSLRHVLAAIPDTWNNHVVIWHGDRRVAIIAR